MSTPQVTRRLAFPNIPDPPYTEISYGTSFLDACIPYIRDTLQAKNVYIIASNSLSKQTKHLQNLQEALGSSWAGTSTGIRPHTYFSDLLPIVRDVVDKKVDCLMTLGGGSLADGAQIIVFAAANDIVPTKEESGNDTIQRLVDLKASFHDPSKCEAPTIPLIFIPTSLSGGEYSQYGGGTDPRTQEKVILAHPGLYPQLVVLDPEVTMTTPESIWLSTGVRAIDHNVEHICSSNAKPEATAAAQESLRTLIPGLLASKKDPSDRDARLKCMLGANLAMTPLICKVWAGGSHGIGHQLGPMGVGHGETSCILMPAVQKYNARVNGGVQQSVKEILWSKPEIAKVMRDRGLSVHCSDLGDALDAILRELGMPRSLKAVGVGRDKMAVVADNATRDWLALHNPIPLERPEQVMEILEMVVGA